MHRMGRQSYREKIVASGMQTVHQGGFATVGVRELTERAGVAQGSFTNHFKTKEEFGVAVLDYYFDQVVRSVIAVTLNDKERAPMERRRAYFDVITSLFASTSPQWHYGCLAGNMALEAAEHSELIRHRLTEIFAEWALPFGRVIRDAQTAGEVRSDINAEETGAALLEAWHGAMLRMKIDRTPAALDRFKQLVFPALLAGSEHCEKGRAPEG